MPTISVPDKTGLALVPVHDLLWANASVRIAREARVLTPDRSGLLVTEGRQGSPVHP